MEDTGWCDTCMCDVPFDSHGNCMCCGNHIKTKGKNKMKLKMVVAAALASAAVMFSGCDADETLILTAANTAGNIGLSAWFAIDDPDAKVKETLKEVVTVVTEASSEIGAGESYLDALTPVIQGIIAKHEELTPAQKNLINTGSSVILSGIDTFLASNEKVKDNAELVSKVVAAFGKGCLTAIERSETCCEAKTLKKAHSVMQMQYRPAIKSFK